MCFQVFIYLHVYFLLLVAHLFLPDRNEMEYKSNIYWVPFLTFAANYGVFIDMAGLLLIK
jgi:hypothetical protein